MSYSKILSKEYSINPPRLAKGSWREKEIADFITDRFNDTTLHEERAPRGIGLWVRIRVMWDILQKKDWKRKTVGDCLYVLLQEEKECGSETELDPKYLKSLTNNEKIDVRITNLSTHAEKLWDVWPRVGTQKFNGKDAVMFDREHLATARFDTPAALREELTKRIKYEAEEQKRIKADEWTKLERSPWLNGLMSVPAFAFTHRESLDRLDNFVTNPDEQKVVFSIVGEPESGKGGLLKLLVERIYRNSTSHPASSRPVVYLNLQRLRGFEPVVSRIHAFLTATLTAQGADASYIIDNNDSGEPVELKLQRIVQVSKELQRRSSGALFLLGDVEALTSGHSVGTPYVLRDERLDRLLELLEGSNEWNKIIIALIPEARGGWRVGASASRTIDLSLDPPGAAYVPHSLNASQLGGRKVWIGPSEPDLAKGYKSCLRKLVSYVG